jgi:hypothetical protein
VLDVARCERRDRDDAAVEVGVDGVDRLSTRAPSTSWSRAAIRALAASIGMT